MSGDREYFLRALDRWHDLQKRQEFSQPAQVGQIAILCCSSSEKLTPEDSGPPEDMLALRQEALQLADGLRARTHTVQVALDAKATDFNTVLQDPQVSSICVIGHGSLSSVMLYEDTQDYYTWRDVAKHADHLKTGSFVQRHCGGTSDGLPVPLGLFAVADATLVIAPLTRTFEPKSLEDEENYKLKPIFTDKDVTYRAVRSLRADHYPGDPHITQKS